MISEKNNSDSKLSEEKITEINENIDNENNTVKMDFFDRNWSWILAFIISCIFMSEFYKKNIRSNVTA